LFGRSCSIGLNTPQYKCPALSTRSARSNYSTTRVSASPLFTKTSFASQKTFPKIFSRSYANEIDTFNVPVEKIRNIAIIAHVDHGKTTTVDKLLTESKTLELEAGERVMDSDQLEKERGITIMAKNTSVSWNGYHVNIVDTPGHSDFGGEVERILTLVDGVVLLVDVAEGPMTQTKFVLSKALGHKLPAIVVLNKMDRDITNRQVVEDDIFDLFVELGATEEQLSYPTLYASSKAGWVVDDLEKEKQGMHPLLDAIINHIPPPNVDRSAPFQMLVTNIDYDEHLGKLLIGRIQSGSVRAGDKIKSLKPNGALITEGTVTKVLSRRGVQNYIIEEGTAGNIVSIAGFSSSHVANTLCALSVQEALQADPIDPPVLNMTFGVNTSPISGKEGKIFSALHIRERLEKEAQRNVTINIGIEDHRPEEVNVSGRGELQLAILIENMRREGFELAISPPQVILKEIDGVKHEPLEEMIIDVDNEYCGIVMEIMRVRGAELNTMDQGEKKSRVSFFITSRQMIGLRSTLINATRGMATVNHLFHSYIPYTPEGPKSRRGAIISMTDGVATAYALNSIESRGILFIGPQTKIYEGMVIGEHAKAGDIDVNPVRAKQLTNIRAASKDENIKLTPPKRMSLEEAIAFIQDDELIEVTPMNIRIRKKILNTDARLKANKRK